MDVFFTAFLVLRALPRFTSHVLLQLLHCVITICYVLTCHLRREGFIWEVAHTYLTDCRLGNARWSRRPFSDFLGYV